MASTITKRTRSQVRETEVKSEREEEIDKKYLVAVQKDPDQRPSKETKQSKGESKKKIKKEKNAESEKVEKKKKDLLEKSNWNIQN